MAIVFNADLAPTKPELVAAWLQRQPWFDETDAAIELVGAFRFDDPNGDVGIETHVARGASGTLYQVPLTYRGAPLEGAEARLVTEMTHSVLGHRWIYEAVADPVALAQVHAAIVTGGSQADVFLDGETTPLPVSVAVRGTGDAATAPAIAGARTGDITTRGSDVLVAFTTDDGTAGTLTVHGVLTSPSAQPLRLDAVDGLSTAPVTLASLTA